MRLTWDKVGERFYETGVDRGVLFPSTGRAYNTGVPWNGLTAVTQSPSGAEPNDQYADNIKYLSLMSAETFAATIEAFTYPPEFGVCDGSAEVAPGVTIGQQERKAFAFSYRTLLGNDLNGQDYGYKLHFIYGAKASPTERAYNTVNDSPEAMTLSWSVNTTPVEVPGYKPTAHLEIDSTKIRPANLAKLEAIIYGTDTTEPRMPMPEEIIAIAIAPDPIILTVTAPAANTDLLGKTTSELESGIVVGDRSIRGTLKYVPDYTGFSSNPSLCSGNYLALQITPDKAAATISVELLGGNSGAKTLDEDHTIVLRITNKYSQSVKIVAVNGEDTVTKIYTIDDLVLENTATMAAEVG